jgi:hypothetical protein
MTILYDNSELTKPTTEPSTSVSDLRDLIPPRIRQENLQEQVIRKLIYYHVKIENVF